MHLLTALVSLFLASTAIAQLSKPLPDPMFPNGGHRIDAQTVVGNNGCLGCARDLQGNYWVSARAPGLTGKHKLYKLGPNGALLNTYDQPSNYAATAVTGAGPWGMRDLAYDGRYIYGGEENVCSGFKVYAFDTITNAFDSTRYWTAPASTVIVRALVFDPTGNSNQGTMWSGDFGAPVVEFDRAGTVLRTVAATSLVTPGQTAAIYGAGWDPSHRTVWWFSQGGSSKGTAAPNGVQVVGVEMETVTLSRT